MEPRSWARQGLRFRVAIALLTVVPWYMIYYVVQPMPGVDRPQTDRVRLALLVIVLSLVTAFLYRTAGS